MTRQILMLPSRAAEKILLTSWTVVIKTCQVLNYENNNTEVPQTNQS